MHNELERDVKFLKIYAGFTTLLCGVMITTAFTSQQSRPKFEEIDVERINIVEKDGKLRMVISNQERQHPGIINGKVMERKGPRPPGMIFFNHLGDEMGGLIYGDNGGDGHFGSFTWDKVRQDQTIGFRHLESHNGSYQTGLEMWQQPNIPLDVMIERVEAANKIADPDERRAAIQKMIENNELTRNRLFLGKRHDNSMMLVMSDLQGRPRIRMQVEPDGTPRLEFLDDKGTILSTLPDQASR
jgi:hypothetical protein